ncbi:MFS transporter [Gordonia hankookensis]|uniref:MFS transporter n=1 Tax=Gordonia hankookensis TaxID=589403 RepID=A0ABR7W5R6_9ACTN|nr:MFS transporter [Gordonia hankookensis]MBD1318175.1 MFS transporter [Gordonia hankookensis]
MNRRSPWLGLLVLCLPMLIVSMDVSVLFFAVPYIAADLSPTPQQQLWIFDIYGFVLAGLLLSMGSLADRIGHRRLLMIGAAAFSAASLAAAFATSAEMLIGARALLAVAGATLMPSTLAMIRHIFDDDAQRAKAVATWNAVLAGGVAVGPIVSGLLLEHVWWGSVFLINVPIMAVLMLAAPLVLPGDTASPSRRVDVLSSLLVLGAMLPVVAAIKNLAADGWSVSRAAMLAAGLVVGAIFVVRQRRIDDPMVDLRLLGERRFATSIWTNLICMFALLGNSILMTQYLQSVLGYSPLRAALWSLAPSVAVGAVAPLTAVIAGRTGRPAVIVGGLCTGAAGFAVLGAFTGIHSLAMVLIGATLLASGIVAATSMIADYVVGVAPVDRAGATSGLLETSSELGGALGIAVLGSVVNAVFRLGFPADLAGGEASRSLAGAVAAVGRLPAGQGATVLDAARHAFVDGLVVAAWTGAGILVCSAVLAGWGLRARSDERTPDAMGGGSGSRRAGSLDDGRTDRDDDDRADQGADDAAPVELVVVADTEQAGEDPIAEERAEQAEDRRGEPRLPSAHALERVVRHERPGDGSADESEQQRRDQASDVHGDLLSAD